MKGIFANHKNIMIMQKKTFILILFTLLVTSSNWSQETMPVELQVSIIDPTLQPGGTPKQPLQVPSVSLDDHTLYFEIPCDGCTLNIVDSNDTVVYTTVVPTGATSLVLPVTLSGEYELQIIRGNYVFYGTIDLP